MALPSNIDPTKPAGTDQVSGGDDEIRDLKQFLVDILGLPVSPTDMTAAIMDVLADGTVLTPALIRLAAITTQKAVLDGTVTWNAAGVTFKAIILNITDTASQALSLLIDLQVGGVSKFKVDKAGVLTLGTDLPALGTSPASPRQLLIVNSEISGSAAIALSKLATGALPSGITVNSANISDLSIINADINAGAAIADTKLATISTAGKVSDSALSANVVLKNAANVLTGAGRVLELSGDFGELLLRDTAEPLDKKLFSLRSNGQEFRIVEKTDAGADGVTVLGINRSGTMTTGKIPDQRLVDAGGIATLALRDGSAITGSNGNTGNDYTLTFNPAFPALVNGMVLTMSPSANNTGPSTLKVDALAVINLRKVSRGAPVDLVTGDIKTPSRILVIYNSSASAFIIINPSQITDAMLSTNVALLDAANVFTANQTIQKASAQVIIDATTGLPNVFLQVAGVTIARLLAEASPDKFIIGNSAGATRVRWDIDGAEGNLVTGKIPLLRIRTNADAAVFDSGNKMIAGTVPLDRVGVSGSFTTASLAQFALDDRDITHNLGTDNVIVMIIAKNNDGNDTSFKVAMVRPDGMEQQFGSTTSNLAAGAPPATGVFHLKTQNTDVTTSTITVHWVLLRID